MSSNLLRPAQDYGFFSTHNALANVMDRDDEEVLSLRLTELEQGKENSVKVPAYPFYDIEMVKRIVIKRFNLPASTNISELRVFHKGTELPNYRSLSCYADMQTKIHLYWSFRDSSKSMGLRPLELRPPRFLESLLAEVNLGFQRGIAPKLTMDGTGGTYTLSNSKGQRVGLFKPRDEEAFAPNNPRSYEGQFGQKGFRTGVLSGEGITREVAAFLLDAQHGGYAGVPQTTKVEGRHPAFCHRVTTKGSGVKESSTVSAHTTFWKEGSFQEYVEAQDTCGDYDPRVFAISDAHYIGILDITVLNLDRNEGNILVSLQPNRQAIVGENLKTPDDKLSRFRLVPIDHGLILPDTMDVGDIDLVWFQWPQSKIPFSASELWHILSLDSDKDAQRLGRKLEIREDCLRTMRVSTRVLKLGAKMHLSLFQITSLFVRFDDFQRPSVVETAVQVALGQAYTAVSSSALINQGRLGGEGAMYMDLHLSDSSKQPYNKVSVLNKCRGQQEADDTAGKSSSGAKLLRKRTETPSLTSTTARQSPFDNFASEDHIEQSISSTSSSCWDEHWSSTESVCDNKSTTEQQEALPFSSATQALSSSDATVLSCLSLKSMPGDSKSNCTTSPSIKLKSSCAPPDSPSEHLLKKQQQPATVKGPTTTETKRKYASGNMDTDVRTTNTRRGRSTAYLRRGTNARAPLQSKCAWTLFDTHHRAMTLDWGNPLFEKTFFECFELLMKHNILEAHPNWKSYPFNGEELLAKSRHEEATNVPTALHSVSFV